MLRQSRDRGFHLRGHPISPRLWGCRFSRWSSHIVSQTSEIPIQPGPQLHVAKIYGQWHLAEFVTKVSGELAQIVTGNCTVEGLLSGQFLRLARQKPCANRREN